MLEIRRYRVLCTMSADNVASISFPAEIANAADLINHHELLSTSQRIGSFKVKRWNDRSLAACLFTNGSFVFRYRYRYGIVNPFLPVSGERLEFRPKSRFNSIFEPFCKNRMFHHKLEFSVE